MINSGSIENILSKWNKKIGHGSRERSLSRFIKNKLFRWTRKSKNNMSHEREDDPFLLNQNPWDEPVCYWGIKANKWLRRFSSPKSLKMKQWWPIRKMRNMAVRNLMSNHYNVLKRLCSGCWKDGYRFDHGKPISTLKSRKLCTNGWLRFVRNHEMMQ